MCYCWNWEIPAGFPSKCSPKMQDKVMELEAWVWSLTNPAFCHVAIAKKYFNHRFWSYTEIPWIIHTPLAHSRKRPGHMWLLCIAYEWHRLWSYTHFDFKWCSKQFYEFRLQAGFISRNFGPVHTSFLWLFYTCEWWMHAHWFWESVSDPQKCNLNQIVHQLMSDFTIKLVKLLVCSFFQ